MIFLNTVNVKTLYLVRHAKSSWDDPFQDDLDRPLNARGRKDAPRMAKRLKEKGLHADLFIASPAERALSTCIIMAETMGYPSSSIRTDRKLYHASEEELLDVVHSLNNNNDEVMIFCHNPGLTEFVNRLNFVPFTDNIPTCGIVCMKLPVSSWKDVQWTKGKVHFFDYPKNDK